LTPAEWNLALPLDPISAGGLDQANYDVQTPTPTGRDRRASSTNPDLLDTAVLDQVFADLA